MDDKEKQEIDMEEVEEQEVEVQDEVEVLDAPEPSTEAKLTEMTDRYQRALAEFDNYRKRTVKEMAARYDDGVRAACEALLPVLDNFQRALQAQPDKEDSFYKGVAMISGQLHGAMGGLGVKEIELFPGEQFNPNFHNAVAHVEDDNFGQNEVAEVLQTGYIHKEKVLRYSMVKVAN